MNFLGDLMLNKIKQILKPEIYFTMDVEGDKTLDVGVPTTYFIDFPLNLPKFCYQNTCLHVHMSKKELKKSSFEDIKKTLEKRKRKLEMKAGKKIKYFRPGHLIDDKKLIDAANELGMEIIGTNVRYYTAWLPKKKIIFVVHSYDSMFYIKLLILYLKLFHPFARWKVFK